MKYEGNLYGRVGEKYFQLNKTAADFDNLELLVETYKAQNEALKEELKLAQNKQSVFVRDLKFLDDKNKSLYEQSRQIAIGLNEKNAQLEKEIKEFKKMFPNWAEEKQKLESEIKKLKAEVVSLNKNQQPGLY